MRKYLLIAVVVLSLAVPNVWIGAQDFRGSPANGESVYKAHCLRCHGKFGDGRGPDAQDLIVQPQDFHTLDSRGRSDFELLISISNGVLFSPMHSWRGRLKDEDMLDVIRYIRALAPPRSTS